MEVTLRVQDEQVALFAVDALRQLTLRFLEKEELSHYHFQARGVWSVCQECLVCLFRAVVFSVFLGRSRSF